METSLEQTLRMLARRTCPSCGGQLDTDRYCHQRGACGKDWGDVWRDRAALRKGTAKILLVKPMLHRMLGL